MEEKKEKALNEGTFKISELTTFSEKFSEAVVEENKKWQQEVNIALRDHKEYLLK